ncbi:MAG TPA: hypothetical protein VIJ95_09025 [Hanamia sp.]
MATSVKASFNHSADKTFKTCLTSIATLGYSVSNSQKDSGIIAFETGRSLFTWKGQKLTCTIIEISDYKTDVIISGVMAGFQITDWGEAQKIANKVLKHVHATLN